MAKEFTPWGWEGVLLLAELNEAEMVYYSVEIRDMRNIFS